MALDAAKLEQGLLAHNFFPRVAKRGDEFPPSFTSANFTPKLASKLINLQKRSGGYGAIAARSTRYDLAPRNLEISHPVAFADLARHLKSSWPQWKSVVSNESSAIRISEHADGRIFSMATKADSDDLMRPGGRFLAKIDVTNFYGSIYTHSLPWAIHGLHTAKLTKDSSGDWANKLDSKLRQGRRGETIGVSTGPGTSGVVGEILLGKIDEKLRSKGYTFYRYIDDYFYVGSTRNDVERFIRLVRDELAQFKLTVHPGKTTILELPRPSSPRWKRSMRRNLHGSPTSNRFLDGIDEAIESLAIDPDDGALRYALITIEDTLSAPGGLSSVREPVIDRLLNIGYLRPIAIGTACRLLELESSSAVVARENELNLLLQEHARAHRTDAATWILHTLLVHGLRPSDKTRSAIIKSGDCLTLALLTEDKKSRKGVQKFLEKLESEAPPSYRRDEYWLLYYQLAVHGIQLTSVPVAYYLELKPLLDASLSFIDLALRNPYLPFHAKPAPHLPLQATQPQSAQNAKRPLFSIGLTGPYSY